MDQIQYHVGKDETKIGYELEYGEFTLLMKNLRRFGPLAEVAIIGSNDRSNRLKPRVQPAKEAVERLQEVLGEENAGIINVGLNELDVLRVERAEVTRAVNFPDSSDFFKRKGTVVVGLATMATSMNVLRGPLMESSPNIADFDETIKMFDQFHEEGVERITSRV